MERKGDVSGRREEATCSHAATEKCSRKAACIGEERQGKAGNGTGFSCRDRLPEPERRQAGTDAGRRFRASPETRDGDAELYPAYLNALSVTSEGDAAKGEDLQEDRRAAPGRERLFSDFQERRRVCPNSQPARVFLERSPDIDTSTRFPYSENQATLRRAATRRRA